MSLNMVRILLTICGQVRLDRKHFVPAIDRPHSDTKCSPPVSSGDVAGCLQTMGWYDPGTRFGELPSILHYAEDVFRSPQNMLLFCVLSSNRFDRIST